MTFFAVQELASTEMLPGVVRRAVRLEHVMMSFFDFDPGTVIPEHDHRHEQITFVVQGTMEFHLGDETRTLKAGEGACIPAGVRHSAIVRDEPAVAVDARYPPREEYK